MRWNCLGLNEHAGRNSEQAAISLARRSKLFCDADFNLERDVHFEKVLAKPRYWL